MAAIPMYLLKMLICSAVLFGYYRVALYNVRFHRWNRFYLLASLLLSVVAPLVTIPIQAHQQNQQLANVITSLPWNSAASNAPAVSLQQVALLAFAAISLALLAKIIAGVAQMVRLYQSHTAMPLQANIKFMITRLGNAPFSFFNWLFWRHDVDVATPNGTRMLNHELAHIRQGHSFDKLFTSLLLCIFWINPFFWFIRRELNMIHEFLADHEAVGQKNGTAFAEMILHTMPSQLNKHNGLSNPFFSLNIKRRLFMITTSTQPKYTYLRRLSGLAAMIIIVCTLAISVQRAQAQQTAQQPQKTSAYTDTTKPTIQVITTITKTKKANESDVTNGAINEDNIQISIDTLTVNSDKTVITKITGHGNITVHNRTKNGRELTGTISNVTMEANELPIDQLTNNVVYMIDGKKAIAGEVKDINPNTIQSVFIYKGETAIKIYGPGGKDGVVEITLKKKDGTVQPPAKIIIGHDGKQAAANPFILVDGQPITNDQMKLIQPNDIESINVLKGRQAIDKYGDKAANGAIEITMKKAVT